MRKGIGLLLVIAAIAVTALAACQFYNVDYWLKPSKDKFSVTWSKDVAALEKSGKLPEGWQQIREIVIKTDNSPAQNWVVGFDPGIKKKQDGFYRLEIFIAHWIENDRYGALVQFNLVDLRTNDTTWEVSRNMPIGRIL